VAVTDRQHSDVVGITVVLCTHNRSRDLAVALESIAASEMPSSVCWEVLVVDNNSTDQTRDIVEGFCERYPTRFRYLFEPKQGLSYARNAGIANAHGEVLAFTDDDVIVKPEWLRHLTAALHDREWAGAAGRVLPAQTISLPPWLSWTHCGGILCANFDLGDQPIKLDMDHVPFGANMAFRREMFEKYGGFRTDLGRNPGDKIGCEDIEFGHRLIKGDESLRYEPLAIVHHPIPLGRITKEYFLSWWFDFGRASIRERDDHPDVYGIPWDCLSLMGQYVHISIMSVRRIFAVRAGMRFFWKCMVWKHAGMVNELCRRLVGHKVSQAADLK
jgi:glucosyl-dolichyl phosphate glucuronosyltransferase